MSYNTPMTNAPDSAQRVLRRIPLFAGLADAEIDFLVRRATPRRFAAGEMIFSEGEPCRGLYVIESGQIKVFKSSPDGREQVLLLNGPGTSVAELPVFDGGSYPASASAVAESVLLEVRKEDIRQLCLEHPEVALKILGVVGARLRHLVEMIEELSFTTVRQRLAALLLRQAESHGKHTPKGVEFDLPWTHQELAAQIGTVRELVSRNLSRFQAAGLIQMEGRRVTVTNPKDLESESQLS